MVNMVLVFPILIGFIVTVFLVPVWIKRATIAGLLGKDLHKFDKREVAEAGGVAVVAGFALGTLAYIAINTFAFGTTSNSLELFAMLSSLLLIAFIAFTDDILGWKIGLRRRTRLILVAFATIPLIAINAGRSDVWLPFFGSTDLGILFPLILIPVGIVGATTTYNFLAGYNGLEAGQGVIILSALALVSYLVGEGWLAVVLLVMVSALSAFLIFNITPAKVFPGDVLTYSVGGLIAMAAILGNFERIAVFFFIPYIAETLLKLRGSLIKQSFGNVKEDGTIELRYSKVYSLNHLAILVLKKIGLKVTERKIVGSIWLTQIVIIVLGFLIFGRGLFT